MQKRILAFIILLLCPVVLWALPERFTLVIDAGHGGHDAGAVGAKAKEKDINLRTALAFGAYVERNCPDVRVIYTRKTDKFVALHERAEIANKAKADLFISIHTNSLPGKKIARGFETYTLGMHRASDNLEVAKRENSVILVEKDYQQHYEGFDPNSSESYIMFEFLQDHFMAKSVELAKLVQNNVCTLANRPDKGVKQAGFLVLRETSMPSCLIELGFISTPDEEQYLTNSGNIDNMAKGIYNAFIKYKQKNSGYTAAVDYRIESRTENVRQPAPAENVTEVKSPVRQRESKERDKPRENNVAVKSDADKKIVSTKSETERKDSHATGKSEAPVFKIQIFVSDKVLKANDSRLKGEKADYFAEGKMLKYTVGSTTDYKEILRLNKSLGGKFPGAFIVAFKNGERISTAEAIQEYRRKK